MSPRFDLTPLYFFVFMGLPLMVQYWYLYKTYNKRTADVYWGYMPQTIRDFSKFTIVLSFLAGLYMVYYSIAEIPNRTVVHHEYEPNGKYILYFSICLLLFGANLWPFALLHNTSFLVAFIGLLLTAVGVALLMDCVLNEHLENLDVQRILAIVSTSILMFQTGIMDLILWSFFTIKHQ